MRPYLHVSKKNLVAAPVEFHLNVRREEMQAGMRELLGQLDRRRALRCLREDLRHAVPPADTPLDEVRHRVLAEASERFADDSVPRERIASVDDQVLFKAKVWLCRTVGGNGSYSHPRMIRWRRSA